MDRISGSSKLPIGVVISYISDYLIIIALAIIYSIIDVIVTPFHQPFALQNYTIQYPYAIHERIPIHVAVIISAAFPILVIVVYTLVIDGIFSSKRKDYGYKGVYRLKDRLWELNCGVLGLLLAQGAAFVITGTLKNLCGKPRPDLIDRCRPQAGAVTPPIGLSTIAICTQTDEAIMKDGFRSFPSGHSSSSFAGLFYLSLYLAGKLHVLDQRGEVWRTFVVLIPTLAASCVAMSRIMDARHHPFDVLFGSAMGLLVAWGSYRQYFPPVSHSWLKGRAYPIRTWGKQLKGPGVNPSMEPFRQAPSRLAPIHDEEQPQTASANVFRDQIRRSQRQRQNPLVRQRDHEWSVESSEDGRDAVEGFEMHRPRYTLTDPEGREGQIDHPVEATEYRSSTGAHPGERVLT